MNRYRQLCLSLFLSLALIACSIAIEEEIPFDEVEVEAPTTSPAEQGPTASPDEHGTLVRVIFDDTYDASQEPAWFPDYEGYLYQSMEEAGIPGLAFAIVQGDRAILAEGFGLRDVDRGLPVTPETLFHIGSTHKSMNAMMIATLVDEGLFDWDTPAVAIYPDFALSDPESTQEVTLRHLLSMQSGIPEEAEDEIDPASDTPAEVFEVASETPLLGMPGEAFSYSNLSASLAGYVGTLAAGGRVNTLYGDYAQLFQEKVLDPIGMESATLYASEAQRAPNHALSYVFEGRELVRSESYDFDGDPLAPAGSLKANVLEMALYVSTQMQRGVAPNGTRVVSEENLTETWEPYLEDYGMGWEQTTYEEVDMIWHTGAYDDFVSVIGFLPEHETGFVILINCEEAGEELIEAAPYTLIDLIAGS